MFRKKKKNQKGFKEIELTFEKEEKKETELPIHIKEENDYAILEPFDISEQKKDPTEQQIPKEVTEIEKNKPKKEEKEEKKIEPVKPKLIIQKTQMSENKPEISTQKTPPTVAEKPSESQIAISKIPINHIETDIDKVMKIIEEKKVVGLEYISKALNIDVERLENWAKMLEDRGLIEIEYPIIGLPKLRKKEWKKE